MFNDDTPNEFTSSYRQRLASHLHYTDLLTEVTHDVVVDARSEGKVEGLEIALALLDQMIRDAAEPTLPTPVVATLPGV